MKIYGQILPGIKLIEHKKHIDHRGDFCELWKINEDAMRGTYRQLNLATSTKGVLRGMHRQDQTKFVTAVVGTVFDVALDVNTKQWVAVELDGSNAILIPPQYAHGYLVLSDMAKVQYMVDAPYNKAQEENFNYNDYGIIWPADIEVILSEKDSK
jgi:dTDP-4-dehydrorhamnose 3,5-epimerase